VLDAMTMKMLSVVTMTQTRTTINKRRATMLRNRVPAAESSGEQGVAEDGGFIIFADHQRQRRQV
jgi:hypothetical protein